MGRREATLAAILLGLCAGALYLAIDIGSFGGLLLVYLAQLPLFAAGLWQGFGAAAIAGTTATLVVLMTGQPAQALLFAAIYAAPVALLVRQALLARNGARGAVEWYPAGLLIGWLTALAFAGLVIGIAALGGPETLQSNLREALAPALVRLPHTSETERAAIARVTALIIPGITAASWMAMTVSNGLLAQGVLARLSANWRPSPDLAALRLPFWLPALSAIALIATVLGPSAHFLGINTLILLSVPFCLAGLAVLHAYARQFARPAVPLTIFYIFAAIFGWPFLLAAVLGLVDASIDVKRLFARPGGKIDG